MVRLLSRLMAGHQATTMASLQLLPIMLTLLRVNLVRNYLVFLSLRLLSFQVSTEECLIDFCELLGQHTGENIAEAVWDTLGIFGIQKKV
jgi:hypothetical protein